MTSSARAERFDVAIIGYGPTGMSLAALLGAGGHRVVVLERYDGLYNLPRAACFDDEIMRTFQKLQLVEEIRPGAVVQQSYDWVNGAGETLLELTYDDPARAGWAALYMMFQPHIEAVLDRRCKQLGSVDVRQGVRADGIEQTTDAAVVRARDADGGAVRIEAAFCIGADGGESFVREALGVAHSDYAFAENWLVCDFHKRRPVPSLPTFRQVCDPAQPIAIVRIGPEHHRFSFMLDADEPIERATDPDRVWERVAGYLDRDDDAELIRVANYVFRSRIAERWRVGRFLLAGDAAHEMPPFLAQGMCSGIRDSHNLAWKLDLILRGEADPRILDSYQPEREPHVRFITEKAIELGRVQTLRDPEQARIRDARLLAARAAREEPEKLQFPGIGPGLSFGTAGGEFFPQGRVRAAGGAGRFDDLVGQGPCILARDGATLALLGDEMVGWWLGLGGRIAILDRDGERSSDRVGAVRVTDPDGLYGSWLESRGLAAAVVRPDWYLFGGAQSRRELLAVLTAVRDMLRTPATAPIGDSTPAVTR